MASSLIPNSVKVDRIRGETNYGGVSITASAKVDTGKVRVVIDVSFGDSVEPALRNWAGPFCWIFRPYLRANAREHKASRIKSKLLN